MEAKKIVLGTGILYLFLITIAFLLPASGKLNKFDFFIPIDKILHIIIHLFLAYIWLTIIAIYNFQAIKIKYIVFTILGCLVYGIIIELLQEQFVDTRKGDFYDVIANSIGTFTGFLLYLKVKIRF